MNLMEIEAVIEAVLFAEGDSVSLEKIAMAIEQNPTTTKKIMQTMMDKYEAETRGIKIIQLENSYQMCSKEMYYETLRKINVRERQVKLTETLLETLSIIAYKQPITKTQIELIRGVKSDHAVNRLVDYNLIVEKGRMDAPGRPILFGTTEDFLKHFGYSSLKDLPMIESLELVENE